MAGHTFRELRSDARSNTKAGFFIFRQSGRKNSPCPPRGPHAASAGLPIRACVWHGATITTVSYYIKKEGCAENDPLLTTCSKQNTTTNVPSYTKYNNTPGRIFFSSSPCSKSRLFPHLCPLLSAVRTTRFQAGSAVFQYCRLFILFVIPVYLSILIRETQADFQPRCFP